MILLQSLNAQTVPMRSRMRLILAQVWTFLDYFHPNTDGQVDWNDAIVKTFPKLREDSTKEDFAAVIAEMLELLEDPSTRLWSEETAPDVKKTSEVKSTVDFPSPDLCILHLSHSFTQRGASDIAELDALAEQVMGIPKLIVDLRAVSSDEGTMLWHAFESSRLSRVLTDQPLSLPRQTYRFYHGLPPSGARSSGGYAKFWKPIESKSFSPMHGTAVKRIVFLVNRHSRLPSIVLALQYNGLAEIIAEGPISACVGDKFAKIAIEGLGEIDVRLSELGEYQQPKGGFSPNRTVYSTETDDNALDLALDLVGKNYARHSPYVRTKINRFRRRPPVRSFPDERERVLAAAKIWCVFSFFFPYRRLMDRNWNDVITEWSPKLERCSSSEEYSLSVTELVASAQDSHVTVSGKGLGHVGGDRFAPIYCRMVENEVVITSLTVEAAHSGIQVGDIIEAIDGEAVVSCIDRLNPYVAASTPQHQRLKVLQQICNGVTAEVTLTLKRKDAIENIVLTRSNLPMPSPPASNSDLHTVQKLGAKLGYVDLTRLKNDEVDDMFVQLSKTEGIVFDMRGYPNGTAWSIAPRLLLGQVPVAAAIFNCPLNPSAGCDEFTGWRTFVQKISKDQGCRPTYLGLTAILVDERTISQAEHTAMFFRAANGTLFVGSPTAGANGDVTSFALHGGLKITLSGQAVQWPDGSSLQRTGLKPDIESEPTIIGIRTKKDEVLDKAVEVLSTKLLELKRV